MCCPKTRFEFHSCTDTSQDTSASTYTKRPWLLGKRLGGALPLAAAPGVPPPPPPAARIPRDAYGCRPRVETTGTASARALIGRASEAA